MGSRDVIQPYAYRTPLGARAIRWAAGLYCVTGIAGTIGVPPLVAYILQHRELPRMLGVRALSGPFEELGLDAVAALATLFTVVSALEVVAGRWLWQRQKRGGVLAATLFPAGAAFWIGFELPLWLLVGPIRMVLLVVGWKSLH